MHISCLENFRKTKLEDQIRRMRQLLNDAIAESKRQAEEEEKEKQQQKAREEEEEEAEAAEVEEEAEVDTEKGYMSDDHEQRLVIDLAVAPSHQQQQQQLLQQQQGQGQQQHLLELDFPQARPRKYTWPMTLTAKERKKQQNKLASRRFRQRRKLEQTHSEFEARQLEGDNRRLRERADELEGKIR